MPKERMIPSVKLLNNKTSERMESLFNLMAKYAKRIALLEQNVRIHQENCYLKIMKISDTVSNV